MKKCSKCRIEKDFSRFHKHPRTLDGFHGVCKDCQNARCREKYANDPRLRLKQREKKIRWARTNPEKARAAYVRFRQNYTTEKGRVWNRRHFYGLEPAEYTALCLLQNNKCAVCLRETRLVIDHNHKTGKVRGLLCYRCNVLVGFTECACELNESINRYLTERV